MAVSGCRLTPPSPVEAPSYEFSRYPLIWGWGTWRRAWRLYDSRMSAWPGLLQARWLESELGDAVTTAYWAHIFDQNWKLGERGNWDYAWTLSCWQHQGLSVVPSANLVSNIGFGPGGTHTTDPRDVCAGVPLARMDFPLRHPTAVERSEALDALLEDRVFGGNLERALGRVWSRLRAGRGSAPGTGQT